MPSPAQHNCPAMQPMRGGTEWPMALNWSSTMQRNRCCSTRPFARGSLSPLHIYLCTAQQCHRLYHPLTKVCMVSRCSCSCRSRSLWKLGATAARAAPRSTLTDDAGRDRVCRTTKRKEGPCTSHMHAGRARSDQVVNSRIAIGSPSEKILGCERHHHAGQEEAPPSPSYATNPPVGSWLAGWPTHADGALAPAVQGCQAAAKASLASS